MMDVEQVAYLQLYAQSVASEWHNVHDLEESSDLENIVEERMLDAVRNFLQGQPQEDEHSIFHKVALKAYRRAERAISAGDATHSSLYLTAAAAIQTIGDYRADGRWLSIIYTQYPGLDELLKRPDEELMDNDHLALCASYALEDLGQFYRAASLAENYEELELRANACKILGDLWTR